MTETERADRAERVVAKLLLAIRRLEESRQALAVELIDREWSGE